MPTASAATPAAAAPAATPAVAPATATPVPAATAPRKGRGLGVFALILGLLAMLGDILVLVVIGVQIASLASNFDWTTLAASFAGVAILAIAAFFGGFLVSALAILLGIIAAVKNRGRAAGVVGAILGFLVFISHLVVAITLAGAGSAISGIPGLTS
ncbi:MAG: hypothetical protein KF727_04500 [Microbacteriaceae bacterium]|nr:hypothetical protein [Microbacteriaceae bacterium]